MKVITWETSRGERISVCRRHEKALKGNWPKDRYGEEYCQVQMGLHQGVCDVCLREL